jgi:ketosteroid isomerase-like protein
MKKLINAAVLIAASVALTFAQTPAEQEVLQFNADFEKAQINRDVAFFERVFADDYTFSGPTGETEDKAKAIAWLRSQKEKPTYKVVSMKSEDVRAKVMGNTAILTGTWIGTMMPLNDAQAAEHTDRGRYTAFLEKRNGQWIVLAEHVSEAPHDRKLMEQEVLKAGQTYGTLHKNRDKAGFERLFADEYMYTNDSGLTRTKAEDITHMTSRTW